MARVSELVRFLCESLTPLGDITARRMFGGYAVYCDGVVFALVAHDILYFKADDGNRPDYEALGLRPFKPFDDKPTVLPYFPPPRLGAGRSGRVAAVGPPGPGGGHPHRRHQEARSQEREGLSRQMFSAMWAEAVSTGGAPARWRI